MPSSQIVEYPLLNPWQHFTIYATHNVSVGYYSYVCLDILSLALYCCGNEQE